MSYKPTCHSDFSKNRKYCNIQVLNCFEIKLHLNLVIHLESTNLFPIEFYNIYFLKSRKCIKYFTGGRIKTQPRIHEDVWPQWNCRQMIESHQDHVESLVIGSMWNNDGNLSFCMGSLKKLNTSPFKCHEFNSESMFSLSETKGM